jgi:hypothetical protein
MHLAGLAIGGDSTFHAAAAAIAGIVLFFKGFKYLRTLRRIENTPTCNIRSLPLGAVEVVATAEPEAPLVAPLTGKSVAYYEVRVEELRSSRHGSRWVTRKREVENPPFHVRDETGRILVMPEGADTHFPEAYSFQDNRLGSVPAEVEAYRSSRGIGTGFFRGTYRFREWHIGVGEPVYVLGVAQDRPDLRREKTHRVTAKLREIRSDPAKMRALDVDGDGKVSDLEWDRARAHAVATVHAEGVEDRVVIASGSSGEMFVLSSRPERALVRSLRWKAFGGVIGGGALLVAGIAYLGWSLGGMLS